MQFVPDEKPTGGLRFVPDEPEQPKPQRSFGEELGRQAGLTARAGVKAFADVPAELYNLIAGPFGAPQAGMPSEVLERRAGLPKPETGPERIVQEAGSGLIGTGTGIGAGRLAKPLTEAGKGIASAFTARPTAQAAGGALGSGASQTAAELKAPPPLQTGVGLAAGMLPFLTKGEGLPKPPTPRERILSESREAGLKVTPTQASDTALNNLFEGLAGQAKTGQLAAKMNQPVAQKLARKALGLPEDAELTEYTFKRLRADAGKDYKSVRGGGSIPADQEYNDALNEIVKEYRGAARSFGKPAAKDDVADLVDSLRVAHFDAGDAIDQISILRDNADKAFRQGDTRLGRANKAAALAIEDAIERSLPVKGYPQDIVQKFRDARTRIAKTYAVQAATDADGTVSMKKFASDLKNGKVLTDELKLMGEFAQTFGQAAANIKGNVPEFSIFDLGLGAVPALTHGNMAYLAAAGGRPALRHGIMSDTYQRFMAQPSAGREAGGIPPALLNLLMQTQNPQQ